LGGVRKYFKSKKGVNPCGFNFNFFSKSFIQKWTEYHPEVYLFNYSKILVLSKEVFTNGEKVINRKISKLCQKKKKKEEKV
jgi:hypothetical protein